MFDNAVFSNDGLELLGQLTATKTLVVREIYADTAQLDASTVNNSVEWWENQTAATMQNIIAGCDAASKFDGQARLLLSFRGGEATLKTIVVTACAVESGVYTDKVVLCMASDNVGIRVFDTTDMYVYTNIALMIAFSNASSVSIQGASTTEYVLQGDLDRLVSCHKAGNPTAGEDQIILGNKTFKHNINAHIAGFARINAENAGETIFVGNTMHPTVSNTDLGTADYPFNNVQSNTFTANKSVKLSAVGEDKLTYDTVITPEKLTCTATYGGLITPIVNTIKFSANNMYIEHDSVRPFDFLYNTSTNKSTTNLAGDVIFLDGVVYNAKGCVFDGQTTFTNSTRFTQPVTLNSTITVDNTLYCDKIYTLNGKQFITPDALAPSASGATLTLNVGSITNICIDYKTFADYGLASTIYVGYNFTVTDASDIFVCKKQTGSNIPVPDVSHKLPNGTYVFLESVTITTQDRVSVLVQRKA